MRTDNLIELADTLVVHSLGLEPEQKVFINILGEIDQFTELLISSIYRVGALPFIKTFTIPQLKSLLMKCTKQQIEMMTKFDVSLVKEMDAYIGIKSDSNIYEFNEIGKEHYKLYTEYYLKPLHLQMASLEKWVLLNYPSYGMAQLASISLNQLKNTYFLACTLDYKKMKQDVKPLVSLLDQTDRVKIFAPGTEIYFSKKGIHSYFCDGRYNLPDGEIFTSPTKYSIEGTIAFNIPTSFLGNIYEDVKLTFSKGKIVDVKAPKQQQIMDIINTDDGSQYIGEFGIGLNPHIMKPYNNIAFDEKMLGSVHFALGQAFPMADNGNVSTIHWDLVLCLLEEYGGGELYLDNILIQKDGMFVLDELKHLNFCS